MALISWWKLNGNALDVLNNYDGIEQGGVTYGDGLLGQCYDNTAGAKTGIILLSHWDMIKYEKLYSISFWFMSTSTSGTTSNRVLSRDCSDYICLYVNQTQSPTQNLRLVNGPDPNIYINLNEWYHCVITADDDNNFMEVYINGVLENSGAWNQGTIVRPMVIGGNTEGEGDITGNHFIGKIDDVQFYDHILSQKEVKELYRGQFLHWNFNTFKEHTVNYIPDGDFSDGVLQSPYAAVRRGNLSIVTDNTAPISSNVLKLEATSNDAYTTSWNGSSSVAMASVNLGEEWTVSIFARSEFAGAFTQLYIFELNGSYSWITGTQTSYKVNENWNRYTHTYTVTSTAAEYISVRVDNDLAGDIIYFDGWQLEKKDHATPFVEGTRTATLYDNTGQGNDAILNENGPEWIEDSIIGYGYYKFNGDGKSVFYSEGKNLIRNDSVFTVSIWVRASGTPKNNYASALWLIDPDNTTNYLSLDTRTVANPYWLLYVRNGGGFDTINVIGPGDFDTEWHHIVGVADGSVMKAYADGQYVNQVSLFGWTSGINITQLELGRNNYYGDIDDFRIFKNALTADEVKELYQQRASIDSVGNFYGRDLNESFNRRGAETDVFIVDTNMKIAAIEDNTEVYLNDVLETTLNAQDTYSFSTSEGDILSSTKPICQGKTLSGTPLGWAGTRFAWNTVRTEPHSIYIYSPYYDANVDIYRNDDRNNPLEELFVAQGTYSISATATEIGYNYSVESDYPVCVYHRPSGTDNMPLYPCTYKLYGVSSGSYRLTAIENDTNVTVYHSDGTASSSFTLTRLQTTTIGDVPHTQFAGPSQCIIADKPVGCYAFGDGDGGDSVPYTDVDAFATHWVLAVDAEFVVFTGIVENATIDVYSGDGDLLDTKTVNGGSGENEPTHLRILNTNETYSLSAGMLFVASDPQWCVQEILANQDETIFWGASYGNSYGDTFKVNNDGIIDGYFSEVGPIKGIVGWWKLNGNLTDFSGNGNDGVNNGAEIAAGHGQSSYSFVSSAGDYIDLSSTGGDLTVEKMTVTFWANFDSESWVCGNGAAWRVKLKSDGAVEFWIREGGTASTNTIFSGTSLISSGIWHFIVCSYDGTTQSIYVDGDFANDGLSGFTNLLQGDDNMAIGAAFDGSSLYYNGRVQDVRLYNRALESKEINILYNLTNPDGDLSVTKSINGELFTKNEFKEF